MNHSTVFKYRKAVIISLYTLHAISLVENFLALNKLCKIVFVKFFSIKIDLLPFSSVIRETSTKLGGNILILTCSFSSVNFLILVS